MRNRVLMLLAFAAGTAIAPAAQASTALGTTTNVDASSQGWLNQKGGSNTDNYITGNLNGEYRNFFTFNIPTFSGPVTSATFSLAAEGDFGLDQSPSVTYTLTSTPSLTFGGLGTGTPFASGTFTTASENTTINFALNSSGLAAIQSGQTFTISGRVTSPTVFGPAPDQYIFGSSGDSPAHLSFTSAVSAGPEPASWAMLILGFGIVGYGLRSTRARSAALAA